MNYSHLTQPQLKGPALSLTLSRRSIPQGKDLDLVPQQK
jgi:hypothetical protein